MKLNNMAIVGENIRELRKNAKITQEQLANYLSIDQSLISKIEKGERSISSDMLNKIATLFCYPLSKLLTEKEIKSTYNIAFRTDGISNSDFETLSIINKIVLNQFKMDELDRGINNDW